MTIRSAISTFLSVPVLAIIAGAVLVAGDDPVPANGEVQQIEYLDPVEVEAYAVDHFRFPTPLYGTTGKIEEQVDEVVTKTDALMKAQGLPGIGSMLQHTVFIKDGVSPMDVLNRLHATATKLAPSLKTHSSVGTIIRVPSFPDSNCLVMLDVQAGAPLSKEDGGGYKRVPFKAGPKEISETIGDETLVFTAGLEAMDFAGGKTPKTIDEQIAAVVKKLDTAMKGAGLGIENMVNHNIYLQKGNDIESVISKFHKEVQKYTTKLKDAKPAGTIMLVNGMASPDFKIEIDAIAARGDVSKFKRTIFAAKIPIAKSVEVDKFVMVAGFASTDAGKEPLAQAAATAKKIANTLKEHSLNLSDVVKYKIFVAKDAGDPKKIRDRFMEEVAKLDPAAKGKNPVEMLLVVEEMRRKAQITVNAIAKKQ